jgi:ATP-dependent RNA helicase DeaD
MSPRRPASSAASPAKKTASKAPAKKPAVQASKKAAPKPAAKKAANKPSAKPAPKTASKPAPKPTLKPAPRPAPKPAPKKAPVKKVAKAPASTRSPAAAAPIEPLAKLAPVAPAPTTIRADEVDDEPDAPAIYEPDLGRQQTHVNRPAPPAPSAGGQPPRRDDYRGPAPLTPRRADDPPSPRQPDRRGRGDRRDQQRGPGGPPGGHQGGPGGQRGGPQQGHPRGPQQGPRPGQGPQQGPYRGQEPRRDGRQGQPGPGPQQGPRPLQGGQPAPQQGPQRRDDRWRDAPRPAAPQPQQPPRPPAPVSVPSSPALPPPPVIEGDDEPVTPPPPSELRAAGEKAARADEIFQKDITFAELGLSPEVQRSVSEAGFIHPTVIQARLIPVILTGRDVLGQAKTGTGKTASFGLPMMSALKPGTPYQGLVLVPTRELALQAAADLSRLGGHTGLRILPVYGGQNIRTQADRLARGPEIIVATPGRMMDMVQRGYVHYRNIKMAVLDEVDRMLDIGFRDDIRRILGSCPRERQTIFVSATISGEIESLARSFANNAEKVIATSGALTVSMVKQHYLSVEPWDKKQLLLHLLTHEEPALTLVFCRTKRTVDNLSEYLQRKGIDAHAIHGDMMQGKRNRVIEKLRSGELGVLVASDLASRGIDVEGITHVVNYDLPEDPDIYVHRIGRTARAGRDGIAWSLVTPEQGPLLTEIELLINAEIPKLDYPDFAPGPVPQDIVASRELDSQRVAVAKNFNRYTTTPVAAIGHVSSASPADADPARFPGGIVPSKLPDRRMMGRMKTARSMKAAISQTLMPPPGKPEPKPQPPSGAGT